MKALIPYLFFNGNCREAMNFYKQCFGGELNLIPYGEEHQNMGDKKANKDEIMHAFLSNGDFTLMASDWAGQEAKFGNNIHLNIDCETKSELDSLFAVLSKEGKVTQQPNETFWGAYFAMLIDKYGIYWMMNCALKK